MRAKVAVAVGADVEASAAEVVSGEVSAVASVEATSVVAAAVGSEEAEAGSVEVAGAEAHAAVDAGAPTSQTQEKAQLKNTNTRHEKNRKQPNESW